MNQQNVDQVIVVNLGSPDTDVVIPAAFIHRKFRLKSVLVMDGAGVPSSPTDKAVISLKKGATTIASIDTEDSELVAGEAKQLSIVESEREVPAGTNLTVDYDETDSGTSVSLQDAKLILIGNWLQVTSETLPA